MTNIEKRAIEEKEELEEGIHKSVEELDDKKIAIEYNGKKFEFPKTQPAWTVFFLKMYGKGKDYELEGDRMLEFLMKLIGSDLVSEILDTADNHFSVEDLSSDIITPLQSYWDTNAKKKQKAK